MVCKVLKLMEVVIDEPFLSELKQHALGVVVKCRHEMDLQGLQ